MVVQRTDQTVARHAGWSVNLQQNAGECNRTISNVATSKTADDPKEISVDLIQRRVPEIWPTAGAGLACVKLFPDHC
jgi:hypothetical protein